MATGAERYAVGGGGNDDDVKKTEAQKDEEAKARTEKMRIAVGCLVSYFVFGWIAYCAVFENWTFTNATYFLMVTLTVCAVIGNSYMHAPGVFKSSDTLDPPKTDRGLWRYLSKYTSEPTVYNVGMIIVISVDLGHGSS